MATRNWIPKGILAGLALIMPLAACQSVDVKLAKPRYATRMEEVQPGAAGPGRRVRGLRAGSRSHTALAEFAAVARFGPEAGGTETHGQHQCQAEYQHAQDFRIDQQLAEQGHLRRLHRITQQLGDEGKQHGAGDHARMLAGELPHPT